MFDVAIDNAFDFLSADYAELFDRSGATPFQHPLWLERLYGTLVPGAGAAPLIVVVRSRPDGRPAMVLPLVRQRHGIMRVVEFADLRVSDYVSPVCDDATFAHILRDAAACAQIRKALKPFDLLRIKNLRDESPPLERLLGTPPRSRMGTSAHAATLCAPFSRWRAGTFRPSYQKGLDKKRRQLRRKGEVCFECSDDPAVIGSTLSAMRAFRGPRFRERGGDLLQKSRYFEFYRDVAVRGRGSLSRLYSMSMDGTPIAGIMGLSYRGAFLALLIGFDQAAYNNQSVGALMFESVAEDCIARGDRMLDFTVGDESYKRLFGAQASPMWQVSRAGSPIGALAGIVVEQVPWAKAMARRFVNRKVRGPEPATRADAAW